MNMKIFTNNNTKVFEHINKILLEIDLLEATTMTVLLAGSFMEGLKRTTNIEIKRNDIDLIDKIGRDLAVLSALKGEIK